MFARIMNALGFERRWVFTWVIAPDENIQWVHRWSGLYKSTKPVTD